MNVSTRSKRGCPRPLGPSILLQRRGPPRGGVLVLLMLLWGSAAAGSQVVIFAAASLTEALEEILTKDQFGEVSLSFASSSSLARQIEAGAPADLYFCASSSWMDYLQARNLIAPKTRIDLLRNRLVLIAPRDEGFAVSLRPDFDFASAFSGRIALADPDHVPAGIYARQALTALGWWQPLVNRLAPTPHVRAALVYVERGETPVGIVYASDVRDDRVTCIGTVPDSLHHPIVYPLAAIRGHASTEVLRVLSHLTASSSAAIFRKYGFAVSGGDGDDAQR